MQRIVIPFNGQSDANNIGAPVQLTVSGRITAVQFNIAGADGACSTFAQLSTSPLFVSPIQQSGLNPQEIAVFGFQWAAPVSAFVGASGASQLVPCDYPVTVGEQLFINCSGTSGTALIGTMVVYLS